MNKIIYKKLIKFLTAANFDKHIVNQLLNEFRVDDDKFNNAILRFLMNGKSFQHKEEPRQLEFDFLDDNRVSKNDSDTSDAGLDGQAHDFQNAIRLINAIFINFGPLDFINREGLSDDIRFLFKIVFEEVTEEEIRDYKINLNLKENGEKMTNKNRKLIDEINDENYVDYGFWLLFERYGADALEPKFFDENPDGVKTRPWCFYAICPKDLGWTDNVIYDPDPKESEFDRDFITDSQCEAFSTVMTSIFAADLKQDQIRLGKDYDGPVSEGQEIVDQMRNRLDVVAADLLKVGPCDGAVRKTLEIRLDFIKLLLNNRHEVLPSLGLAPNTDPEQVRDENT